MHTELSRLHLPSKADLARLKLLEAGIKCFALKGLDGVTIRELAKEAKLNSAAICYYFGSKEGLYEEVLNEVMRFFQGQLSLALQMESGDLPPNTLGVDQAKQVLRHIIRSMATGVLQDTKAAYFAMLMVREQTQPSSYFTPLYQQTIEPMHKLFARLWAVITGESEDSAAVILRVHTVIGQLQVFIMARETLLRRMDWPDYQADRSDRVADILTENFEMLVDGFEMRHLTHLTEKIV